MPQPSLLFAGSCDPRKRKPAATEEVLLKTVQMWVFLMSWFLGSTSYSTVGQPQFSNSSTPHAPVIMSVKDFAERFDLVWEDATAVYLKLPDNYDPKTVNLRIFWECCGPECLCHLKHGTTRLYPKNAEQTQYTMGLTTLAGVPVTPSCPGEVHSVRAVIYHSEIPLLNDVDLFWMLRGKDIKTFEMTKRTSNGAVLRFHSLKLPSTVFLGWDDVQVHPYVPPPKRCRRC